MKPLAACLACLLLAAPAAATPELAEDRLVRCYAAAEIARHLSAKYGEAPVAVGLQTNGDLLKIWMSADGSSWTAVTTSHEGVSCIVSAGKSWETLPVVAVEGAPT